MEQFTNSRTERAVSELVAFLARHRRIVLLTGAGISAGSGIPTYRDARGTWLRSTPIQHQDFMTSELARKRYWLRSYKGWPAVAAARPSPAHLASAELERAGRLALTVTQNVDRLHQKAGSEHVIDLHGRLDEVVCMTCGAITSRDSIQAQITGATPDLPLRLEKVAGTLAPDGDADIELDLCREIEPPPCLHCGGILKPNVVFFGDNVPRETVDLIYQAIATADALLIAGSSLQVFSGYRFCRHAATLGIPIASINPGKTRGDDLIGLRITLPADDVLPVIAGYPA